MKRLATKWMFTLLTVAAFAVTILHGTEVAQTPDSSTPSTIPAKDGTAQSLPSSTLKPGAEILSDTMGVDFSGYMRKLHEDIQRNWTPLIPAEVNAPQMKKGVTGIRLTILPDGRIGSMKLEIRSGDVSLDRAAWMSITNEGRFPRLPQEFHGPLLELRLGFFYNTSIPSEK